jgi:hypothetical protein
MHHLYASSVRGGFCDAKTLRAIQNEAPCLPKRTITTPTQQRARALTKRTTDFFFLKRSERQIIIII